jgi:hypothetical protein
MVTVSLRRFDAAPDELSELLFLFDFTTCPQFDDR